MSEEGKDAPKTAPEAVPADKMLNIRQAADFIGVTPQRISRLQWRGEIDGKRVGWRGWSFREADLMAYVERAAGVAGAAPPAASALPEPPPARSTWMQQMTDLCHEMGPGRDDDDADKVRKLADEAPIVRMANAILVNALESGASDLHIEPARQNVQVRVRIDGVMQLMMTMPKHIQFPIMNRFKVMADITPFRSLVPHIGMIPIKHGDRNFNLRVSTIPNLYGESIVIHVIENVTILKGLSKLWLEASAFSALDELSRSASGLLLFAGPPGSGLTTTAYTVLNKINSVTHKMCSFEELPEYTLGGIDQMYRRGNRISVREGVQALLRQNTDVLFLGDIRDEETARCAVEAAQAGVLVMATIAALDSLDAIRRLTALGVAKADVGQAVIGVVGQRLVRNICADCKEQYTVSAFELQRFGLRPQFQNQQVALYRGAGCENCRNRGYRGRIALFEVLQLNPEIAELVRLGAARSDLKDAARAAGFITLTEDGLAKILQGVTTPDEVMRVAGNLARI